MTKKKKKSSVLKRIIIFLLILLIGCIGFIGYRTHANGGGMQGFLSTLVGNNETTLEELDPIQVLLLGVSTDLGGKITDTIMVATYNPKNQTASLLSIPRDTYTGNNYATGSANEKINALYTRGIDEILDEVNDLTGLDLKYYMVIDNQALIKLVDVLEGVEFEVPIDMYYTDKTQGLKIDLKQGLQVLDGNKAEQLLRFRKNDDGTGYNTWYGSDDIGRRKTQRNFIMTTAKQALQAKNIFKIRDIIDILYEYVETNLSISDIKAYVPYAINFDINNLKSAVLPGVSVGPTQTGSLYAPYWFIVINEKETATLVKELYSEPETQSTKNSSTQSTDATKPETHTTSDTQETNSQEDISKKDASKIKIEILNGSNSKTKLSNVKKELEEIGFVISSSKSTSTTSKTTILNKSGVEDKYIEKIKQTLGAGIVSSNSATSSSKVDITIIIGEDYE